MNNAYFRIGYAADFLGVSVDTLRRWGKKNVLNPSVISDTGYRYYSQRDLYNYLEKLDMAKLAFNWAGGKDALAPPKSLYCQSISDFSARLPGLENVLQKEDGFKDIFSLITSSVSEIGNNSFDHNIGNWPDVPGIFFGHSIKNKTIVLADRGQGVLKTLKRVRQDLIDDKSSLITAFTDVVSGRSPESRGNGLKYVRRIIVANNFTLKFQTGNAVLTLKKGDKELNISTSKNFIRGCFAVIKF